MTHASSAGGLELTNQTKNSQNFKLCLVQQPLTGKAVSHSLRARGMKWPIEPPPVLELTSPEKEPQKWLYIHNPNWFCVADLIYIDANKKTNPRKDSKEGTKDNLTGLLASSLHKVKNPDDRNEHGYFVFGDLNVRDPGRYKLEFTLFEMCRYETQVYAAKIDSCMSNEFEILNHKSKIPTKDSTKLSKTLSESGVKIRLRKESTKRKQNQFDWSATATENFNYGNRSHPATLAPLVAPYAAVPTSSSSTKYSRNAGVDITDRLSVVQDEMNLIPSPVVGQHHDGGPGSVYVAPYVAPYMTPYMAPHMTPHMATHMAPHMAPNTYGYNPWTSSPLNPTAAPREQINSQTPGWTPVEDGGWPKKW